METRRRSSIAVSNPAGPRNQARNFGTKFSLPAFVKRVDKLTQKQKDAVIRTGFGNLLLIGNHIITKNVLVELMERWHPQKQAFVLAKGEVIRITVLDVALILGLRVIGQPVNIATELDLPFLELEREYGAALWNRKITVASIDKRLDDLGDNDDDDFVRSFLLFTFGTILFPNSSGKVDSRYLCFLQDLDSVGKFAWGVAVLEDLFSWLSKRKEIHVQYVGGCLILLQIWFYEHIDVARPRLRNHPVKFPRACRWDNSKCHQRDWSILQFKNLQSNQISRSLQLTLEELELEIVKELLASPRERVTPHIHFDSETGGALENEDCSHLLRPSLDKASTSMGSELYSQYGAHCPQHKQNPNVIVTYPDMRNNEREGALANEKHNPDFIARSSDVSDNQGDVVLANLRTCQHVSKKGYTRQLRSSGNLALTLMRDQHSSRPASNFIDISDVSDNPGDGVLVNEKELSNFIATKNDMCNNQGEGVSVDNDCSNQLRSICDLVSTSSRGQCSSPSASCSSQDNVDESTSGNSLMKRMEISLLMVEINDLKRETEEKDRKLSEARKFEEENKELRMENTKLRKEVESLQHQNRLHLPAFDTLTRLNSIVFSEIADEVLGTNL